MDKPKSLIKILAILIIIFSGLSFMDEMRGLLVLFGSLFISSLSSAISSLGSPISLLIRYVIITILDVFFIIGAIGLLKYKEWGRKIVVYVAIGSILYEIGNLIYSKIFGNSLALTFVAVLGAIVGVILYGLIIFYFSKKKVKKAFV